MVTEDGSKGRGAALQQHGEEERALVGLLMVNYTSQSPLLVTHT